MDDQQQPLYDLDSIKKELQAWVDAAPSDERRQTMERELEIWEEVCDAQNNGEPLPTGLALDLSELELDALSPTLCRLPGETLSELNLSGNELTELPETIGNLTGLTSLDLSGNELTELPAAMGRLTRLTSLDVNSNELTELPVEFGDLTALDTLDLSDNEFTAFPAPIGRLTGLSWLGLTNNQLTTLPPEIGEMRALIFLSLRGNRLTALPPRLGDLPANSDVHAQDNPITSLPENIGQWNGFRLQINGGNLPERVLTALQSLSSGPQIGFNMTQAGQVQTAETDRQLSRPLEEAVASWIPKDHPGKEELLNRFQAIREEWEHTDDANRMREFSRLLDRLPEMADYRNITTRPIVQAQVGKVLNVALTDETGRKLLFAEAQAALGTCGDRVAEGWSKMLTVLDGRIAIRDDWPQDRRLACIRGAWLAEQIEWKTNELCKNVRFTDPVEVAIGFKRRLAEEFGLPHVMKDMLYPACAVITDEAMQGMRDYLNGLNRNLLVDRVADHPLWVETMNERQADALELIDESFHKLVADAIEVQDFEPRQTVESPMIQALYDNTSHAAEWAEAAKEIGHARDYARRLICIEQAAAVLGLTSTRRATTDEASSSNSHVAPPFNPPGGPADSEAAERRKARLASLEAFASEQVAGARRLNYENLKSTPLTQDDYEQIRSATGAAQPRHEWAKLDQAYHRAAPVGRLANEDRTFIFVPDSATPESPHVRVILAPAAALRERAAELDAVIAENKSKQPRDRKKVSFNCETGAERREQKRSRSLQ